MPRRVDPTIWSSCMDATARRGTRTLGCRSGKTRYIPGIVLDDTDTAQGAAPTSSVRRAQDYSCGNGRADPNVNPLELSLR